MAGQLKTFHYFLKAQVCSPRKRKKANKPNTQTNCCYPFTAGWGHGTEPNPGPPGCCHPGSPWQLELAWANNQLPYRRRNLQILEKCPTLEMRTNLLQGVCKHCVPFCKSEVSLSKCNAAAILMGCLSEVAVIWGTFFFLASFFSSFLALEKQ